MAAKSINAGEGKPSPHRDQSPSSPTRHHQPVQSSAEAFAGYSKQLGERESTFLKKMEQQNTKFLADIPQHADSDVKEHYELYAKLLREHTEKFKRKAKEHVEFYRLHHPANPNPPPSSVTRK